MLLFSRSSGISTAVYLVVTNTNFYLFFLFLASFKRFD